MTDVRPHILILCPSMWPRMKSWGETQRMYYLACFLSEHGWKVSTISPGTKSPKKAEDRPVKYTPCFFGSRPDPEEPKDQQSGQTAGNMSAISLFQTVSAPLTPLVKWFYNEPDCYEGLSKDLWILRYQKKILGWIADNRVDLVLVSGPAFTLFRMGKAVKRKFPFLPVLYDYRDPWYLWNLHKGFAYRRERDYLKYADGIAGFSRAFTDKMISAFCLPPERCAAIYNGYSETDWKAFENSRNAFAPGWESGPASRLRLAFVGNISLDPFPGNFRNPSELIRVIEKFPEVECAFIGASGPKAGTLERNIRYIGKVSQKDSFAWMKSSDVLISIHLDETDCSGKYLISGKFYDYMRSGRVMWHIGSGDSLMSRWIAKYGLGIACPNEPDALYASLEKLVSVWRQGKLSSLRSCTMERIRSFSREYQNERYLHFIETIKNCTNEEEQENG